MIRTSSMLQTFVTSNVHALLKNNRAVLIANVQLAQYATASSATKKTPAKPIPKLADVINSKKQAATAPAAETKKPEVVENKTAPSKSVATPVSATPAKTKTVPAVETKSTSTAKSTSSPSKVAPIATTPKQAATNATPAKTSTYKPAKSPFPPSAPMQLPKEAATTKKPATSAPSKPAAPVKQAPPESAAENVAVEVGEKDPAEEIAEEARVQPSVEKKALSAPAEAESSPAPTPSYESSSSFSSSSHSSSDFIALDQKKRVSVSLYNGQTYVHIREFYEDKQTGQMKPGKGAALSLAQWEALKQNIDEVDALINKTKV